MNVHSLYWEQRMREETKEQITQQRRSQILEAALSLFSQKGYGETTIPDIAREAGIAVGTVYNYFTSKRDLLVSIIATYIVDQDVMDILERSENMNDEEWLRTCIKNRLDFGFENLEKYFFVFNEIQRDPQLRQMYAEKVFLPAMALLEQYLESRKTTKAFRSLNSAVTARAIIGMIIGFSLLYRIDGENGPCQNISRQHMALSLTDLILRGLQMGED
jgi:AcrR family transcriptional regulator